MARQPAVKTTVIRGADDASVDASDRRFRDKLVDVRSELLSRQAVYQRNQAAEAQGAGKQRKRILAAAAASGVVLAVVALRGVLVPDPAEGEDPKVVAVAPVASAPVAPPAEDAATRGPPKEVVPAATTREARPAKLEAPRAAQPPTDAALQVVNSQACRSVRAHECVGAKSTYSLGKKERPTVWMEVRASSVPQRIKHVYYHDGQKRTEVTLRVAHERTRTWSRFTVHGAKDLGPWRVQIETEEGKILDQVSFQMIE